jgi:hypothetical protein
MKNEYLAEGFDDRDWYYDEIRIELGKRLGTPNSYSGSADWGGATVWSISGDKYTGVFVGIDDNNDVFLISREETEEGGYEDEELYIAHDFEQLDKLLNMVESHKSSSINETADDIFKELAGIRNLSEEESWQIYNDAYDTVLNTINSWLYDRNGTTVEWGSKIFRDVMNKLLIDKPNPVFTTAIKDRIGDTSKLAIRVFKLLDRDYDDLPIRRPHNFGTQYD